MKKLITLLGGLSVFLFFINPVQALTPQESQIIRNMIRGIAWHQNNDGTGSGLDADLLDGLDSTQYLRSDQDGTLSGNLTVDGETYLDGNVGIGTTSPSVNLEISDLNNDSSFMHLKQHAANSDYRTGINFTNYDNVNEIGSPSHSWYIQALNNYNGFSGLAIGEYNDALGNGNACDGDQDDLCFVHRMYFDNLSGNVGIGTSSPEYKLNIKGDTALKVISDNGTTYGALAKNGDSAGTFYLYNNGNTTTQIGTRSEEPTYFNGGNVGIGTTSPNGKLDVQGELDVRYGTATGDGYIYLAHDNSNGKIGTYPVGGGNGGGGLQFFNNGDVTNPKMTINTSGNVGIGTAAPTATLDVAGTLYANSDITTAGQIIATSNIFSSGGNFSVVNGTDLVLKGRTGGFGRALVDMGGSLYLNYGNDFSNGVYTPGNFNAGGQICDINGCIGNGGGDIYGGGNGTAGTLAKWNNSTTIDDTNLYVSNDQLGINSGAPQIDLAIGDDDTGLHQDGDGVLAFYTNNDEEMRITNDGMVGINDSTPEAQLKVGTTGQQYATKSENWATSGNTYGVFGLTNSPAFGSGSSVGVWGYANYSGGSGDTIGVFGRTLAQGGNDPDPNMDEVSVGVYGDATNSSGLNSGVWGDVHSSTNQSTGVTGWALAGSGATYGVMGGNPSNDPGAYGVFASGDLGATGNKPAVVYTESQGPTELYAMESPDIWFEDIKEDQLVNGKAYIELDSLFLETVTINKDNPLQVFIQMYGPEDVYVERGEKSFNVIEKNNGTGNSKFSYRVLAKRKYYENQRMDKVYAPIDKFMRPDLSKEEIISLNEKWGFKYNDFDKKLSKPVEQFNEDGSTNLISY